MTSEKEIQIIEYTLKSIFRKDEVTDVDVYAANKLFKKWKKLKKHVEETTSPVQESIIDDEPEWQTKK